MKKNARDANGRRRCSTKLKNKKVNYTKKIKKSKQKENKKPKQNERKNKAAATAGQQRQPNFTLTNYDLCYSWLLPFGSSCLSFSFCLDAGFFFAFVSGSFDVGASQQRKAPKTQLQSQLQAVRNRENDKGPVWWWKSVAWFTRDRSRTRKPRNCTLIVIRWLTKVKSLNQLNLPSNSAIFDVTRNICNHIINNFEYQLVMCFGLSYERLYFPCVFFFFFFLDSTLYALNTQIGHHSPAQ